MAWVGRSLEAGRLLRKLLNSPSEPRTRVGAREMDRQTCTRYSGEEVTGLADGVSAVRREREKRKPGHLGFGSEPLREWCQSSEWDDGH